MVAAGDAILTEYRNGYKRDFGNVTAGNLVVGLDRVFSDYRNARVTLIDGVNVVLRSMQGVSDADLEKLLQTKRNGETTFGK